MLKQARLYIGGDVIGVGFRAWTKIQAKIIGVVGWVKNSFNKPGVFGPGGGVETVIQGEKNNVNKMVEVLKIGPSVSRIEEIEIYWQDPKENFENFEILE
jgi:acylphosphatase